MLIGGGSNADQAYAIFLREIVACRITHVARLRPLQYSQGEPSDSAATGEPKGLNRRFPQTRLPCSAGHPSQCRRGFRAAIRVGAAGRTSNGRRRGGPKPAPVPHAFGAARLESRLVALGCGADGERPNIENDHFDPIDRLAAGDAEAAACVVFRHVGTVRRMAHEKVIFALAPLPALRHRAV